MLQGFSLLGGAVGGVSYGGCRGPSPDQAADTSALESRDWFKSGVDRLYLATMKSDTPLYPNSSLTRGYEFLFVVGCYGEPEVITRSLSNRRTLDEFPISAQAKSHRGGQCEILLGDRSFASKVSSRSRRQNGAVPRSAVVDSSFSVASSCVGLGLSTLAFLAAATAGSTATASSAGAASPFTVPVMVAAGYGMVSAGGGCVMNSKDLWRAIQSQRSDVSKRVFFDALEQAEAQARQALFSNSRWLQIYDSAISDNNFQLAAALHNYILVQHFNQSHLGTFENGWGRGRDFFAAVEEIQASYVDISDALRDELGLP